MASNKNRKRSPFKSRYVLGEGYTVAQYATFGVALTDIAGDRILLKIPSELHLPPMRIPRVRLVLERVCEKGKGKR